MISLCVLLHIKSIVKKEIDGLDDIYRCLIGSIHLKLCLIEENEYENKRNISRKLYVWIFTIRESLDSLNINSIGFIEN